MSDIGDYYVSGVGIYLFSNLPKDLQVFHATWNEASDFREVVAKRLDQSSLCFQIMGKENT